MDNLSTKKLKGKRQQLIDKIKSVNTGKVMGLSIP
jgi:hypothetical protein